MSGALVLLDASSQPSHLLTTQCDRYLPESSSSRYATHRLLLMPLHVIPFAASNLSPASLTRDGTVRLNETAVSSSSPRPQRESLFPGVDDAAARCVPRPGPCAKGRWDTQALVLGFVESLFGRRLDLRGEMSETSWISFLVKLDGPRYGDEGAVRSSAIGFVPANSHVAMWSSSSLVNAGRCVKGWRWQTDGCIGNAVGAWFMDVTSRQPDIRIYVTCQHGRSPADVTPPRPTSV
ncbi:hypothetical protein DFP72DRAFT_1048454 [Ephemerocybe angulata]|uniref:Uncharacterized protein n=1 Tax=Ephemerocybe angulata TaxID=980116 RepID=A0A8H6HP22_9AGAR|nr:hypothetical protein DFP72DRAFT_1048454 [Tulosesus angulatus]